MTLSETKERSEFGQLRKRANSQYWQLRYTVAGVVHEESTKTTSRAQAEKFRLKRQIELGLGVLVAPDTRRVGFSDLERMLTDDYRARGLRSVHKVRTSLIHLRKAFGAMRAVGITTERVTTYTLDRLDAGAARSTVNYELAMLRRAFNLAIRANRLTAKPSISTPDPKNARKGFFEPEDFAAVYAELPDYLQPPMQFAYLTGWRVRSEVAPLKWERVDFRAGVVRLDVNTTKNGEGREFPFDALPALAKLLRKQREDTSALERETGAIIPWVFHNAGVEIRDYYHAWRSACDRASRDKKAGTLIIRPQLVGRLVHDFRRTAVRNLVRAGVPRSVAMQLTGHKTESVFERYNVTDGADLHAAVTTLAAHMKHPKKRGKGTSEGHSHLRAMGDDE